MAIGKPLLVVALSVVALALAGSPALAQDKEKLAEVTKKDLSSKVPNFFCFGGEDNPDSKRLWLRIDNKHFVERYPSGTESKFKILGRTKIDGVQGTVTAKVGGDEQEAGTPNDGSFQVFIPDRGSATMQLRFRRAGDEEWGNLPAMKRVE
jgi:hypothetical protein